MHKSNRNRIVATLVACLCLVAIVVGAATALGASDTVERPILLPQRPPGQGEGTPSAELPQKTDVTPRTPERREVPEQMFDQPFVDAREVGDVVQASRELSFRAATPASLGRPAKVLVHRDYRPQALALVYDHPTHGRFALTQEPIDMPEAVQRNGLEELAAQCNPETGCVGSWTMHPLANNNQALVISSPPDVTAVIWIHTGGVRFQLMGPSDSLGVTAALAIASLVEVSA